MWFVIAVIVALVIVLVAAGMVSPQPQSQAWWLVAGVVSLIALSVGVGSSVGMWSFPHGGMMVGGDRNESSPSTIPGVGQIHVVADDLFFDPDTIRVPSGEPTTIEVSNEGQIFHDFSIPGVDFRIPIDAGTRASGTLPGLPNGQYRVECTVPGHAQAGMVGVVVVGDA